MFNSYKIPIFAKAIFSKDIIWRIPTNEKKIFLTFDDGPTPGITSDLLDLLKSENISATFFCLGKNVERYPEVFDNIIKSGHSVGNHSFSHKNAWKTTSRDFLMDVYKCGKVFESELFRPPYGRMNPFIIKKLSADYKIVMWTLLSRDFDESSSYRKDLKNIYHGLKPGVIIVFHDSVKASKKLFKTLPEFITNIKNEGYSFDKIIL